MDPGTYYDLKQDNIATMAILGEFGKLLISLTPFGLIYDIAILAGGPGGKNPLTGEDITAAEIEAAGIGVAFPLAAISGRAAVRSLQQMGRFGKNFATKFSRQARTAQRVTSKNAAGRALTNLGSGEVPFDAAKLAKIKKNLEKRGVTFVMGDEGARLSRALGGEAVYIPESGRPGIIALGPNASRTAVVEELIHLGQHRNLGWRAIDNVVPLEIQAQKRLLATGRRLGWSADEMNRIQRALEFWSSKQ